MLLIESGKVRNKIPNDRHVWKGVDLTTIISTIECEKIIVFVP